MLKITNEHVCYSMSKEHPIAAEVEPGESFIVATKDCYSDKLKSENDVFTKDMWSTTNPATGPVAVKGAAKGDVLKVVVEDISIRDHAVMCVQHGFGAMGDQVEGVETRILPIRDGQVKLNDAVAIPINPMIGVIGTAPAGEQVLNGTPGEHGGNMDCKLITTGAIVYLPVAVDGGLLALGDLHAVMGDGEVCICGAEVSGEVRLWAEIASSTIPTPCVETADAVNIIASAKTLDECETLVLAKAFDFLTTRNGYSPNDAVRLMSLTGELQVCQVVDPLKTMRFAIPKGYCEIRG